MGGLWKMNQLRKGGKTGQNRCNIRPELPYWDKFRWYSERWLLFAGRCSEIGLKNFDVRSSHQTFESSGWSIGVGLMPEAIPD
ncbi:unnamed protein product [Ambrosiozyma monospora]|uniref:Unnamed protein product n=1 Tax=Ambrosiozyma monospora TaxID=43982 RepID=A0ACB5SVS4_AMBMO|nr:unnamed protein product [Ambrosiozyma monospora]